MRAFKLLPELVTYASMERVNEILNINGKEFNQVLMNVSAGDKLIGCAALSAAFINGKWPLEWTQPILYHC